MSILNFARATQRDERPRRGQKTMLKLYLRAVHLIGGKFKKKRQTQKSGIDGGTFSASFHGLPGLLQTFSWQSKLHLMRAKNVCFGGVALATAISGIYKPKDVRNSRACFTRAKLGPTNYCIFFPLGSSIDTLRIFALIDVE
jgi:hypothetical protein